VRTACAACWSTGELGWDGRTSFEVSAMDASASRDRRMSSCSS